MGKSGNEHGKCPPLKVAILAAKDLTYNNRVFRQAKTLQNSGHSVVLFCLRGPAEDSLAQLPSVAVMELDWLRPTPFPVGFGEFWHYLVCWLSLAIRGKGPSRPRAWDQPARPLVMPMILRPASSFCLQMLFKAAALRHLRSLDLDLIQSHDSHALPAAAAVARAIGKPLVYDAVEVPINSRRWSARFVPAWILAIKDRADRCLIEASAAIMVTSQGLGRLLAEAFGTAPPLLVRNCRFYQECERSYTIRQDLKLAPDESLLLYLNAVNIGLGLEQAIESLAFLPDNVHLATLGPMPDEAFRADLAAQADRLGLSARVHFLPPRLPSEMIAYASGADLGLVPIQDISENFRLSLPNRVFELLMARLPMAVSSLPEIKAFVVGHGLGECFDETDPRDIAKLAGDMLKPERLAAYRAAADKVARRLCWEEEGKLYLGLIEETGARGAGAG